MTREQKAWRVIRFSLLAIQVGLLVALIMTDATWNILLLVPILMIAAILVMVTQANEGSE